MPTAATSTTSSTSLRQNQDKPESAASTSGVVVLEDFDDEIVYSSDYESYVSEEDEEANKSKRMQNTTSSRSQTAKSRRRLKTAKLRAQTSVGGRGGRVDPLSSSSDSAAHVLASSTSSSLASGADYYDWLSAEPVVAICPRCRSQIVSDVTKTLSPYNWLACAICPCITPCVWDILKDVRHRCPNCRIDLFEAFQSMKQAIQAYGVGGSYGNRGADGDHASHGGGFGYGDPGGGRY